MENFLNMLDSQLVLFVYLGIGIYMRKVGMIDDNTRLKWIDFIIKISLPCMVFSSFNEEFNVHTLKTTGIVFLLSLFVSALSLLLGNVLFRRYRAEKASILKYATLVNNSGFLGLPLIESVYGATGLLYASIHIIPNRIMMWTAGISVFTKADMKTKIKNILLNPAIIAIYLGILRRLFEILLPHFLEISISKVGGVTSPLSMIVIGSMLVEVEHKKLLEGAIIYFSAIISLPEYPASGPHGSST